MSEPGRDPELYALLGSPLRARRAFNIDLRGDDWDEDFLKLAEVTRHYVTVTYRLGTDLKTIERRLRENHAFAYVGIDQPGNYSATPTDIYFPYMGPSVPINFQLNDYQWASQAWITNLSAAWDWNKGWAHVGIIDGGSESHLISGLFDEHAFTVDHADLKNLVTVNHSYNMIYPSSPYYSHGTHVLGLVGANVNNAPYDATVGGAGVCWHCSVQYATSSVQGQEAVDNAIWLADQGSQVINLSGGYDPFDMQGTYPTSGIPCSMTPSPIDLPFCHALTYMRFRDVVFVAAAGNSRQDHVQFPASEPMAIGVGGTDSTGAIWDDNAAGSPWGPDSFDIGSGDFPKCPNPSIFDFPPPSPIPTHQIQTQCGSNYSESTNELDFVAPARKVISAVPLGWPAPALYPDFYFADENFKLADDGYAYATGTSMASPIVSGIVALLRSANPLISRDAVYATLKATASNNGVYNGTYHPLTMMTDRTAWGVPNAGNAMTMVLGKVGGITVKNRLTPMFVTQNSEFGDHLYSTRPQVILGASSGNYLKRFPDGMNSSFYGTDIVSYHPASIVAYPIFPGVGAAESESVWTPYPIASFWVFTSDKSLWDKQPSIMKPLYRMSFNEPCNRQRRHSYPVTQAEIDSYFGIDQCTPPPPPGSLYYRKTYHYDGIEGYILSECPQGFGCNNFSDPSEPQALYRRYSSTAGGQGMSALIMQGELSSPALTTYTLPEPGLTTELIGYVFPNVDSDGDGLPDGLERMYGLLRFNSDSDGDGCPDGVEFPIAGIQQPGKDPNGPLGGICQ